MCLVNIVNKDKIYLSERMDVAKNNDSKEWIVYVF